MQKIQKESSNSFIQFNNALTKKPSQRARTYNSHRNIDQVVIEGDADLEQSGNSLESIG